MKRFAGVWVCALVVLGGGAGCDGNEAADGDTAAIDTSEVSDVAEEPSEVAEVNADVETEDTREVDGANGDGAVDDVEAEVADVEAEVTPVDVVDPCEPNPCTEPPEELGCTLDRRARTEAATGSGFCEVVEGQASCEYPLELEACGLEAFCSLGECVEVGSYCDFPLDMGPWSFGVLHRYAGFGEIDPETGDPVDECCFDLNGDGQIDNGFGAMWRSLSTFFPVDLNEWLDERLRSFSASFVSQLWGLPDVRSDVLVGAHRVDLLGMTGSPATGSPDPFTAVGTIALKETSFISQSVTPRVHVEFELQDGAVTGAYGVIGFAIGSDLRNAEVTITRAEGQIMLDEEGLGFGGFAVGQPGMKFGGLISRAEWLSIWNDHVDSYCTCTTFPEGSSGSAINLETFSCNTPVQTCTEPDPICRAFTSLFCQPLVDIMAADIDTDGDTVPDAISAGWWSKSVPTRVTGRIRDCP